MFSVGSSPNRRYLESKDGGMLASIPDLDSYVPLRVRSSESVPDENRRRGVASSGGVPAENRRRGVTSSGAWDENRHRTVASADGGAREKNFTNFQKTTCNLSGNRL